MENRILTITMGIAVFSLLFSFSYQTAEAGFTECISPPTEMVSWWPLDEDSGTTSEDIQDGNNGTHVNNPSPVAGMVDGALEFDGTNHVSVPDADNLDLAGSFSIDAWVKIDSEKAEHNIVSKDTQNFSTNYNLHILNNKVFLAISFDQDPQPDPTVNPLGTAGKDGAGSYLFGDSDFVDVPHPVETWRHVTATYDDATKTMKVYLDGQLDGEATFDPTDPPQVNDEALQIGERKSNASSGTIGSIDEVEIFNRALTDSEINDLHAAGDFGKCKVSFEHFLAYQIKETNGTEKFDEVDVTLSDQFIQDAEFEVKKPYRLLNPVDKNEEGLTDEETHYVGYKIKVNDKENKAKGTVIVQDQFGELSLDLKREKLLLVPSAKAHDDTPDELDPIRNDHFKCYDVKVTKNTPKFEKTTVSVFDPNFDEERDMQVKKPRMYCNPVEKEHNETTEVMHPDNHLVCYDVKKAQGEDNHDRTSVFTNNQFGEEALDTKKEKELCVPATVFYPDNDNDGVNSLDDPDDIDPCIPNNQSEACLAIPEITGEHFLTYQIKETKNTPKFDDFDVELSDQFVSDAKFEVDNLYRLLNPVDKNDEGIDDEETHYVGYKIKVNDNDDKAEGTVLVKNQFGIISLDIKREKLLLVPSAKDHDDTPDELDPVETNHFKCYDVKVTKNTPKFEKLEVDVEDPNFEEDRTLQVKKPRMYCNPVEKIHEDETTEIENLDSHLVCYDVKKAKGEDNHDKTSVFTNNQFGPEELDTKKEKELCIPSVVIYPDTDGDGLNDFYETNVYQSDPNTPNTIILDTTLEGSPGGSITEFGHHLSTGIAYGGGNCPVESGTVFVLDNGYININAIGILRATDCIVPTPTHDFVEGTLHCDEGDVTTAVTAPLSSSAGATMEGDFELTDFIGPIGTCTNATVYVESAPPDGNGKWLAKSN